MTPTNKPILLAAAAAVLTPFAAGQNLQERLNALEKKNQILQQTVDGLTQDVEKIDLGGLVPKIGELSAVLGNSIGVGQGAAKVYDIEQGLSIGGYGEFIYKGNQNGVDQTDAQRAILYFGYKFSDKWVFNSEIEIEHGSTGAPGRNKGGSVSLEFGYLDYMHSDTVNFRAGLLLSPMGLINQLHEPTAFLASNRPQTEGRIIPSTWREMGAGFYGDVGDFAYQTYLMTALDAEGFSDSGLRGGRGKGARTPSDDMSFISRVDYVGVNGLTLGGSLSVGQHGQDNVNAAGADIGSASTMMYELHVDYRTGPWVFRALYAAADIDSDDVVKFNNAQGNAPGDELAESMNGFYGEVAYDVMNLIAPGATAQVRPFVRWEQIDTQATMAPGGTADPSKDNQIVTMGVNYKPIPQVVIKADYEHWEDKNDRFNIVFGYVF
ncbi:MAG: hypothetical protein CMJ88_10235 [Planctomycetes bacterium]|nr:hypothetical protein [Planctomycetota bacterium]